MKKRNFKQFVKENLVWFLFGIWLFLIAGTIGYLLAGKSMVVKIMLIFISIVYTAEGIEIVDIVNENIAIKNEAAKEKKLLALKKRYENYTKIVNNQLQETLKNIEEELLKKIDVNERIAYLIAFDDYMEWIHKNRIEGKLDSFIIASCLVYSLIDYPIITAKGNRKIAEAEKLNIDIAIKCAFKIISEPTTYYEDDFWWIEEKHQKVKIVIPNGLINDDDLHQRIINTIHCDVGDKRNSIMQFSNFFYLMYLNCQ